MQSPRANLIDPATKAEILATALDMVVDKEIGVQVTLQGATSRTVNLETGVVTATAVANLMRAIRRTVDQAEADRSNGRIEVGDRIYLIAQAEVSGELQGVDSITEGDDVFEVIRWETDAFNWFYSVQARDA